MINLTSKQKGNLTELKCISAFYELGYQCSIPYGENSRYDFIADVNGKLLKIQCKTSHEVESGTYWDNICYLVPINECSVSKKLRFIPPKNGQKVGITFASDYELPKQLSLIEG